MDKLTIAYQKGFAAGYRQVKIDEKEGREKYRLKVYIIDAIRETLDPDRAEKLYQKWLIEKDGEIVLDQLVQMILKESKK